MNNHPRLVYDFGPFRLDPRERLLVRDGESVPLPPKVFDTLLLLVENNGRLIEKEELLQKVWADAIVEDHGLSQNIFLLRRVLGEGSNHQRYIETVPKRGYRFVASVKEIRNGEAVLTLHKLTSLSSTIEEEFKGEAQSKDETNIRGQLEQLTARYGGFLGKKRTVALTTIAIAVCLVVSAAWWVQQHRSQPKLAFQKRDWVLITSFDNRTGDPLFDGTIECALERELSNSQFVNVVPPERIGDALQLLKQPPNMKLDAALGREVCLRDGGIRALLAGRVEKLGSTITFSVKLIDPAANQVVATTSEEASDAALFAGSIRRLSSWTREALGEALTTIRENLHQLEKVTTPSLKALQLYTEAESLLRQGKFPVAEQLLRQALTEDSEFASAWIMLSWSLKNQKKPEDEWKQASDRALELVEKVSERERYFIQGSYYSIRRQDKEAVPIYEALLQRYPDHYWGRNNLAIALDRYLYRVRDSLPHMIYHANLRPNDFNAQAGAFSIAVLCHQREEALRYAKRAYELITPELMSRFPFATGWIESFLAYGDYETDDLAAGLTELNRLSQTVDTRQGAERDGYCNHVARGYLQFGRLQTAESFARKIGHPLGSITLALIALTRNDKAALRNSLLEHLDSELTAVPAVLPLLTRAGLLVEAQKRMSNPALKDEGFLKVYQGEMALTEGKRAQAISLLEQGIAAARSSCQWQAFYAGCESLAACLEQQGDIAAALGPLEQACREDVLRGTDDISRVFWLRDKSLLARLYRKLGRTEDAQRVEAELARLLAYADEDHPVLRQLKKFRSNF